MKIVKPSILKFPLLRLRSNHPALTLARAARYNRGPDRTATMAKRSLFSILSEYPWWLTAVVAIMLFGIVHAIFPPLAPFAALPFVAVAAYFAYKQLRGKSPVGAVERLQALREMSWENFGAIISEAYRREGYTVEASGSAAFDFTLCRNGRITLVQCRRWKVSQVGVGPLRELHEAIGRQDAFNAVCITAGGFSDKAREYAAGKPITLLSDAALAAFVGHLGKPRARWFAR
jgi:restriction system protein